MSDSAVLFDEGQDTYVSSDDPTASHAGLPYVLLAKDTAVYLIRQGQWSNWAGATASAFKARFRAVDNFGGGSVTFKVYRLAETWDSDTLWADRPDFTADTPVSLTGTVAAGGLLEFDVTSFVALALASPATDYGLALVLDTVGVSGRVYMLGASDGVLGDDVTVRPTLTGELTLSPDAPSALAPAGGRAVGETKPVVAADFGDVDISAVQFQQKATNIGFTPASGFSSPAFDSGTVVTSDPSLDLSATAFGGFNLASYWTMRVRDRDLAWSLWSDPVSTRYAALPTVTVTTVGTVGSPLFTVAWTHSGTQTSYQVVIRDALDPTTVYADSGRLTGTALSYTPDYLLPDTRQVAAEVRVWDNITDREKTPGVETYGSASATFAFSDDITITRPTGLLVTQIGSSPWNMQYVSFNGEQAGSAAIVMVRDGRHTGRYRISTLDPPDVGEGSATYAIPDYDAEPFTDHIYGAKLDDGNGHTSPAEEYLFTARDVTGVWVLDESTGEYAQHSGERVSIDVNDQITESQGIGESFPSFRKSSIGYRRGTLGGKVKDEFGVTATDWMRAWRSLAHNAKTVRLAYSNVSFPAEIWNVTPSEVDDSPDPFLKQVDFSFAQTGQEHLADDNRPGPGQMVTLADFESGTAGNVVPLNGADDVFAKTGTIEFRTTAKMHGSLGAHLAPSSSLTWLLKNNFASTNDFYQRIRANTEAGAGSHTMAQIVDVNGTALSELKCKPSGRLLATSGATTYAQSAGKITFGTTDDDWYRVTVTVSWDASGNMRSEWRITYAPETTTYNEVMPVNVAGVGQPYALMVTTGGSNLEIDLDSVRRANDASAYLGPLNPDAALPTPQLVLVGGWL